MWVAKEMLAWKWLLSWGLMERGWCSRSDAIAEWEEACSSTKTWLLQVCKDYEGNAFEPKHH